MQQLGNVTQNALGSAFATMLDLLNLHLHVFMITAWSHTTTVAINTKFPKRNRTAYVVYRKISNNSYTN